MWKSLVQRALNRGGKAYDVSMVPIARGMYNQVVREVAELQLPSGARVLDVSTGPGRVAIELAKLGLSVTGVDLSPSMIKQARQNALDAGLVEKVTFDVGDVSALPYPDDSFDLVVSTAALHHWTDPVSAAVELYRVVRPDGRLWVYDARFPHTEFCAALHAVSGAPVRRDVVRLGRLPLLARLSARPRATVA